MNGVFITFEGPDGAGKTTQIRLLGDVLRETGRTVVLTREPGGTEIGDQIRSILLSPANTALAGQTEVLLYAAQRAQHVHERILPALRDGAVVLCDRFIDASIAYQAHGLGFGESFVRLASEFAAAGLKPDRTYLLDLPAAESRKRLLARSASGGSGGGTDAPDSAGNSADERDKTKRGTPCNGLNRPGVNGGEAGGVNGGEAGAEAGLDRIERRPAAYHERVREAFLRIAAAEPERVLRLDATRPVEELCRDIVFDCKRFLEIKLK